MTRLPAWQSALEYFLTQNREQKFRYGRWDCCLFVCEAIEEMTGIDTAADFRGRYRTRKEAREAMREYAGRPSVRAVAEKVTAAYGMPVVETLFAQRGDLMLIKRARDYSLGILALNGLDIVTVTPQGLQRIPLSHSVHGWRV